MNFGNIKFPDDPKPLSILFTAIERQGADTWRFDWDATTGPYRIFLHGSQIFSSSTNTATIIVQHALIRRIHLVTSGEPEAIV